MLLRLVLVIFLGLDPVMALALAVEKTVETAAEPLTRKLTLPVRWEMTRSLFDDGAIVTETENYQETWILHVIQGSEFYLTSPRGSYRVERMKGQGEVSEGSSQQNIPKFVKISADGLASLLGIPKDALDLGDQGKSEKKVDTVVLHLMSKAQSKRQNIVLNSSPNEYYQVSLLMGM